jgi:predicted nucleic acid-binding protein
VAKSTAYDGRVYIADRSAWSNAAHATVKDEWVMALRNRQIATCPIVKLELLYSARDGDDYDRLDAILGALRDVPVTRSVTNAALSALRQLAHLQPLYQRSMRFPDLLIAAAAQDAAIGVLHYDHHYERLAEVLEFDSRWIAPAGSL